MLAQVQPGEVAAALPTSVPEQPESLDAVLADLDRVLVPGLTHWQHPRFFAYFPANSSPAGVLGDLLSSGIGAQGMIWATSPAATELEQVVLDQLRRALGLPDAFARDGAGGGVIQDTASTATFTAVLAALHRATDGGARRDGVPAGRVHDLRLDAGALLPAQGRDDERPRRGTPSGRSPSTRRRRPWTSPPCARRWRPTWRPG